MNLDDIKNKYEPIDGKWYIKGKIGEGSYGSVYIIERNDISGTQNAALKIITIPKSESELSAMRNSLGDERSVTEYYDGVTKKLMEELKLMSVLKGNSNIVSYEDHNIFPHDDGIGYDILIRMELLTPLTKLLNSSVSEHQVIKLGIDVCKALEACQKFNIVHRDIKPENIFISKTGTFKLGDFGVSKTMNSAETIMTKAGTYTYMAPELYKGDLSGTNVDIYSLGMVMYKLLNFNREPFLPLPPEMFTFEQREKSLLKRMKGVPFPKPVNASDGLAEIILKACEYNPKIRYESPLQMRTELENLLLNKTTVETIEENNTLIDDRNEVVETVGMFSGHSSTDNLAEQKYAKDYNGAMGFYTGNEQAKEKPEMSIDETVDIFDTKAQEKSIVDEPKPVASEDQNSQTKQSKSKSVALTLAIFPYTGLFGIHDFYLGKKRNGLLKLFTLNFCIIGWILDIVMILCGKYSTKDGEYLK